MTLEVAARLSVVWLFWLGGCQSEAEEPKCTPGYEKCECVEGKCLDGLMCASETCVAVVHSDSDEANRADHRPRKEAVGKGPTPRPTRGIGCTDDFEGCERDQMTGCCVSPKRHVGSGPNRLPAPEDKRERGAERSRKTGPSVRLAKPVVHGSLDEDVVRGVVRAHINEVRHCYKQGLAKDPNLKGRVAVQFTIGPTGKVPVAVVAQSSLKDESVANCVAKAVKRWKFARPSSGNAVVTYPFVLEPD